MQQKFTDNQVHVIYSKWAKRLQLSGKSYDEQLLILIRASGRYFGIYEIWKDVPDYEGLYQASSFGRVKSLNYRHHNLEKALTPSPNSDGYLRVNLWMDKKPVHKMVHKIIAISFLNHVPNGNNLEVNHKNFIRTDNGVLNLEIITHRENTNQKHLPSSSKYTGVFWHKRSKKWRAAINVKGKQKHIGYFNNELAASHAYEEVLKTYL